MKSYNDCAENTESVDLDADQEAEGNEFKISILPYYGLADSHACTVRGRTS